MQVFHGVRPSQPPRPRVMHEVSAREGSREAFTGRDHGLGIELRNGSNSEVPI